METEKFRILTERVEEAITAINRLKQERQNLIESNKSLENKLEGITDELDSLQSENTMLKEKLSTAESGNIEGANEKVDDLVNKLNETLAK